MPQKKKYKNEPDWLATTSANNEIAGWNAGISEDRS
jgi:hypothetical protein